MKKLYINEIKYYVLDDGNVRSFPLSSRKDKHANNRTLAWFRKNVNYDDDVVFSKITKKLLELLSNDGYNINE